MFSILKLALKLESALAMSTLAAWEFSLLTIFIALTRCFVYWFGLETLLFAYTSELSSLPLFEGGGSWN
jgi:hypothetical protein